LPYYAKFGWEATVLCATPESSDGVIDQPLARTVPAGIRVEKVSAWPEASCRRFGFGHFGYRCLYPLYVRGSELLSQSRFETVFFSTTAFPAFVLGRLWKRRFGCRIVYDYQDPWCAGESRIYDLKTAPGGMLKYRLGSVLAALFEPFAMRGADHVISVSHSYVSALCASYPWLRPEQFTVMPFGVPTSDFELLAREPVAQTVYDRADGLVHFVSVGRGGPDMFAVLDRLFAQIASLRRVDPEAWGRVRFHFVGTNYSPAETTFKVVEPLATLHGVADLVDEKPQRIPYLEALQALKDSHGVLLVGSVFPDYTPSKLFSCVESGRPGLALLNRKSLAVHLAEQIGNLRLCAFDSRPDEPAFEAALIDGLSWLQNSREDRTATKNQLAGEYSAEQLTQRQCRIFSRGYGTASCPE